MNFYGIGFWWIFGIILTLAEFLLPGLVVVFLGFGAFVVATLLHFGIIYGLFQEIITWFISSLIFLFTLRFAVIMYYPSDTRVDQIDEDDAVIGEITTLLEDISKDKKGRIKHSESTWSVISENGEEIKAGSKVEIIGRDNLTWIVKKNNI